MSTVHTFWDLLRAMACKRVDNKASKHAHIAGERVNFEILFCVVQHLPSSSWCESSIPFLCHFCICMHNHSSSLAHPRHAVSVAHPERARCALHCLHVSILLMVSGGAAGWGPVAPVCSQLCAANCSSGAREPRVFGPPLTCTYLALDGPRSRPTRPAHNNCRECHT